MNVALLRGGASAEAERCDPEPPWTFRRLAPENRPVSPARGRAYVPADRRNMFAADPRTLPSRRDAISALSPPRVIRAYTQPTARFRARPWSIFGQCHLAFTGGE